MITNFTQGLITNESYNSRSRVPALEISENCRVDKQGWIVPRKGRIPVDSIPEPSLQIPELPDVENIGVTYSDPTASLIRPVKFVLQAAVVDTEEVEQELPDVQGNTDEPLPLLSPKTVVGVRSDPVDVSTAKVVGAEDPFGLFEEGTRADVHTLKVGYNDTTELIDIDFRITTGVVTLTIRILDYQTKNVVRTLRFNSTYQFGGEADVEPDQTGNNQGPHRKRITWDGTDDFGVPVANGQYYVEFLERKPILRTGEPITDYFYHLSLLGFSIEPTRIDLTATATHGANYIDVYATLSDRSQTYQWIARFPVGQTLTYQFPIIDDNTPSVLEFEMPDIVYTAKNNLRLYSAEANSNRLYLSHYDPGTGEKLLKNQTHPTCLLYTSPSPRDS